MIFEMVFNRLICNGAGSPPFVSILIVPGSKSGNVVVGCILAPKDRQAPLNTQPHSRFSRTHVPCAEEYLYPLTVLHSMHVASITRQKKNCHGQKFAAPMKQIHQAWYSRIDQKQTGLVPSFRTRLSPNNLIRNRITFPF